jgi:hypothetical protein
VTAPDLLARQAAWLEAYPGDIFSVHAGLLERTTCLNSAYGGGSMTALPIVETSQGEIAAYIPTNLISITDGQLYLDADPFAAGFRPAMDIARSVSRIGGQAQHPRAKQEAGHIHRRVEDETLDRFLDCGDLHKGFARVRCDACGHEYVLPFSCKTRCFCPSCHQKRMLIYGEWLEEEVLAPAPHRQYVFAVPKVLRACFPSFGPYPAHPCATTQPHIHALVTDGVFHPNGVFRVLPPMPAELLEQQLRRAVLEMLLADEAIDNALVAKLLSSQHSGFSVDN